MRPATFSPEATAGIKRIAVVSIAQDRLSGIQLSGSNAAPEGEYTHDVPDWHLHTLSEGVALGALEKSGRFEIVRLDYDHKALWSIYDESQSFFFGNSDKWRRLLEPLASSMSGKDLDAAILILPSYLGPLCDAPAYCGNYGRFGFGAGLSLTGPFGRREFVAYAALDLVLFDAKTGKLIRRLELDEQKKYAPVPPDSDTLSPTAAELETIRETIVNQLMPYIPAGLNRMRLTN